MTQALQGILDADRGWTHFQMYEAFPEEKPMRLIAAGSGPKVSLRDGGILHVTCEKAYRPLGFVWGYAATEDGITVPGTVDEMDFEETAQGRVAIYTQTEDRSLAIIFFKEGDGGEVETGNPLIEKVDIRAVAANAAETHETCQVIEEAGDVVEFKCGHKGHERYALRIFDQTLRAYNEGTFADHSVCGECYLEGYVATAGQCYTCRRPVLTGDTYFIYDENIFCAQVRCSPGPAGADPQIWGELVLEVVAEIVILVDPETDEDN
jgi:hypothetical protein